MDPQTQLALVDDTFDSVPDGYATESRSLAEERDPRLVGAWPRATRIDRRRFELLKRAYVDARYSESYEIGVDDLAALTQSVERLRDLVEQVCRERIEALRAAADL